MPRKAKEVALCFLAAKGSVPENMPWTNSTARPYGFGDAQAVLASNDFLLALWDHDRCRGWQLYQFRSPRNQRRTKWLIGAGSESVGWAEEQAIDWANRQIEPGSKKDEGVG